jgi:TM2 domain-containing membrane protein YozV
MELRQNPGVASVLSFVLPGLGQIYALETWKGLIMALVWVIGNGIAWSWYVTQGLQTPGIIFAWGVIALAIWAWAIWDAKVACEEWDDNDEAEELELEPAATTEE